MTDQEEIRQPVADHLVSIHSLNGVSKDWDNSGLTCAMVHPHSVPILLSALSHSLNFLRYKLNFAALFSGL